MTFDLEKTFLYIISADVLSLVLLCFAKKRTRRVKGKAGRALCALRDAFTYIAAQIFLVLAFLAVYVMYVKNGYRPSLSNIGVAFIFVSVFAFWALWRFGAISQGALSLLYPLFYSLFLIFRWACIGRGPVGAFSYIMYNPVFGFIGSSLAGGRYGWLYAISAALPFACAALGKGLAEDRGQRTEVRERRK